MRNGAGPPEPPAAASRQRQVPTITSKPTRRASTAPTLLGYERSYDARCSFSSDFAREPMRGDHGAPVFVHGLGRGVRFVPLSMRTTDVQGEPAVALVGGGLAGFTAYLTLRHAGVRSVTVFASERDPAAPFAR